MATFASPAPWTPAHAPSPREAQTYVHPGRTFATGEATSLVTVVGSGVVVCLWDSAHRVGGLAHFLLPEVGTAPSAPRYGDVALNALMGELLGLGATPHGLRARLYGGSAPPISSESGHLGDRNVAAAQAFLQANGIPLLDRDVGGTGGRKVIFDPRAGIATVTRIGA
jgi:chemotaxis protein CheD